MRKKMIIKIISWIIFIGLVIALIVGAINIYMVTTTSKRIISVDDAKDINADCIIVLGAGVKPSGKPSWMLEDRIIVGEQLYNVNAAPKLLMSGDHGRENYDEVNTMKNYAINDGIPSEDIFMDHAGFSTYDSMYRAKEIFGAENLIVVTQKYHLYRALYIGDKLGIDVYGVSSDQRQYAGQARREVREMFARCKDMVKVMARQKPQYLGEAIPLWNNGDVTNDK